MVTIYFRGGEDVDFTGVGTARGVDTTGGRFRAGYARNSLQITTLGINDTFWTAVNKFSVSSLWWTARVLPNGGTNPGGTGTHFWHFTDAAGVVRLRARLVSQNNAFNAVVWAIEKVNAAGTATQLGSNIQFTGMGTNVLSKMDIQINYSTTGSLTIYTAAADGSGSVTAFTYSGDVTTDGQTLLAGFDLGHPGTGSGCFTNWSEIMVADSDSRTLGLVTLVPTANGNTHNFDTGTPAAANINENAINDATLDGSSVAGQIDQYTIGTLPTGTFSILQIGITARMMKGLSGPAHMDLGVRSGSTPADYWSPDVALPTLWQSFVYDWTVDPSTSAPWLVLPVNIGLRSVV